ncbi:unnamed protein product [Sympodiomycopsis kandeliae]
MRTHARVLMSDASGSESETKEGTNENLLPLEDHLERIFPSQRRPRESPQQSAEALERQLQEVLLRSMRSEPPPINITEFTWRLTDEQIDLTEQRRLVPVGHTAPSGNGTPVTPTPGVLSRLCSDRNVDPRQSRLQRRFFNKMHPSRTLEQQAPRQGF